MATETDRRDNTESNPYVVLGIGAAVGIALLIGSGVLFYYGWTPLIDWIREGKRDKLWEPMTAILLALLGEGVMFVAFQSARKVERTDSLLRRILYGYNAIFTSHLLLLLLVLINVFVYIRYPSPIDTTAGGFYSLSDVSRKFIEGLERPVNVYMVLDPNSESYSSMQTMLAEMQKRNPKYFTFEEIAPNPRDPQLRQLVNRFSQFGNRPGGGLIVALGNNPEKNHTFIGADELSGASFDPESRGAQRRQFNGEVRLMQELMFLADDKKKPVLYFTQGHGEPDLNGRRDEDLGALRQRLTNANYEVRPLLPIVDSDKFTIPEDAEVVVIVGPKKSMADMLPALRNYMNPTDPKKKKGKLLVFLGPTPADRSKANAMTETGLEPFLREFNVEVTGEQILAFAYPRADKFAISQNPMVVLVAGTKEAVEGQHPMAQMLKDQSVSCYQVRQIRPGGGQNPMFRPEVVLGTDGLVWSEADAQAAAAPADQLRALLVDARLREQRLVRDALPVVVAVTEGPPMNPHSFDQSTASKSPRLMVVGCSTIAGNDFQAERTGGIHFDMVKGCIEWCRERYAAIGVEPKSHQYFMLPNNASWWMLAYLPWLMMLLFIAGFGVIVWTVRRR